MKVLSFLTVVTCLVFASNFVSAGPKDKQMSYKLDGQTLNTHNGRVRTSELRNVPFNRKNSPVATSQRYDEGWLFVNEPCYVGGEEGFKYRLYNHEWHQTDTFEDGSTITQRLLDHTVCDILLTGTNINYGTWELEWTVVGGTKRFEGASGSVYSSGTYQDLWATPRFGSASFEGVTNYDLD